MNAERIRELFMEGVSQQIDVREYRGGYLVTTPITLADGAPFQVRADFDGEDVTLNDLGQVAGELDAAGFDITSQSGEKHWSHVLQSVGFAPAIGADPWELALTAPRELFGAAVLSLADVAASADGLRVLSASYRPKTLQERLVRSVHAAAPEARINQRARMRMRGGGERQVSFSASTVHTAYVQAITASQGPYVTTEHWAPSRTRSSSRNAVWWSSMGRCVRWRHGRGRESARLPRWCQGPTRTRPPVSSSVRLPDLFSASGPT